MKTLKFICFILFIGLFFLACSKERIVPIMSRADSVAIVQEAYKNEVFEESLEKKDTANSIQNLMDSTFVEQDSIFADTIEDILTLSNTKGFGGAKLFFDGDFTYSGGGEGGSGGAGGGAADPYAYLKSLLPLEIEFIRLHKISDMVLMKKHTMANEIRLSTEGMIFLTVKKNGVSVDIDKIKPRIEISTKRAIPKASLYYEVKSEKYGQTWSFKEELSSSKIITRKDTIFYVYQPTKYGWSQIAAPYDTLAGKTPIKFSSKSPKPSKLNMYLVYPKTRSIIKADTAGLTPNVPIGEKFDAVVITNTVKKEFYAYFEGKIANKDLVLDVLLKKFSQEELVKKLRNLK